MTIKEVARIYFVDESVIRRLSKKGIIPIYRISEGYGEHYTNHSWTGKEFDCYHDYREFIDPEDLDVLEYLISEIYSDKNLDWDSPRKLKYARNCCSVEEYIQANRSLKSDLEIILSLL